MAKGVGQAAKGLATAALGLIPGGQAGVVVKVALGVLFAVWWTSGPGAKEASDVKAKLEPAQQYARRYFFKGRGRKEFLRNDMKGEVNELVLTRGAVHVPRSLVVN